MTEIGSEKETIIVEVEIYVPKDRGSEVAGVSVETIAHPLVFVLGEVVTRGRLDVGRRDDRVVTTTVSGPRGVKVEVDQNMNLDDSSLYMTHVKGTTRVRVGVQDTKELFIVKVLTGATRTVEVDHFLFLVKDIVLIKDVEFLLLCRIFRLLLVQSPPLSLVQTFINKSYLR